MILRLLIVDDDETLCRHLKTFFERQSYKVEMAHSGAQALELAQQFHPHLMFLDIGLPGISGIDVLRQVKEKDPSIRVIMITGQTEDELMRKARSLGADDYVTKPFTLEYLSGEVLDKLHKQLFVELRSTSEDLALEREKMELLFAQVQEGVILCDAKEKPFLANPAARTLLGLIDASLQDTLPLVFHGFKSKPEDRLVHLNKETGEPFDLLRESPKQLVVECRANPIFNQKKELNGYMLLIRNVTMERRAETAMHRFISLISHKLRTPLVTIRAYPRLLLSENSVSPLNDFQRNALEVIQKQCLAMEDMVNQLIAFSSLDPEELLKQVMNATDLIKEAIKLMPDPGKDKLKNVHMDQSLSSLFVEVDPTLMQHAVRNIVDNAFKFGATTLTVSGVAGNGHVTLRFTDDGPGIPPEDRERVFERFYQVEKFFSGQVPGVGLGLAMVRQAVESHGGRVWIESQVGSGSTVCMDLPAGVPPRASA
jgi:signal transduction histidine kinase